MELLIVALVLFAGMVVSWLMLPGSVDAHVVAPREMEVAGHAVIELA